LTRFTPQFWYEVQCTWLVGHGATYVRRYACIIKDVIMRSVILETLAATLTFAFLAYLFKATEVFDWSSTIIFFVVASIFNIFGFRKKAMN
jgi:hypothetical protein